MPRRGQFHPELPIHLVMMSLAQEVRWSCAIEEGHSERKKLLLTRRDHPAEMAGRRRLQKTAANAGQPSGHTPRAPSIPRSVTDPRVNTMGRRRQSIREQKAPGPGM
jgi:hypothetical protein